MTIAIVLDIIVLTAFLWVKGSEDPLILIVSAKREFMDGEYVDHDDWADDRRFGGRLTPIVVMCNGSASRWSVYGLADLAPADPIMPVVRQ